MLCFLDAACCGGEWSKSRCAARPTWAYYWSYDGHVFVAFVRYRGRSLDFSRCALFLTSKP